MSNPGRTVPKNLSIALAGESCEVRISRRARRMWLTVHHDGRVVVTVPARGSLQAAEKFAASKADWIARRLAYFRRNPVKARLAGNRRQYAAKRHEARALITARVRYFSRILDFSYKRLFIRNQKSRWGSCSRAGNLSFNFQLVNLPPHLADYIVVHELCHLEEFNHSRGFWELVARILPNWRELRAELRQYSLT